MNPRPVEEILALFWSEYSQFPEDVRSFAQMLVLGTLEHLAQIDAVLVKYAENWQLDRMAVIDRSILRFATYEILYREDIPPKVSINEAVNIAKKFSQQDSGKFVNGILDKINHSEKSRAPHSG